MDHLNSKHDDHSNLKPDVKAAGEATLAFPPPPGSFPRSTLSPQDTDTPSPLFTLPPSGINHVMRHY